MHGQQNVKINGKAFSGLSSAKHRTAVISVWRARPQDVARIMCPLFDFNHHWSGEVVGENFG